jgi:hypothetical protein
MVPSRGAEALTEESNASIREKEDASSPTVATESVMLTSVNDALEGRDVATVDLPGAFLQADMEDVLFYLPPIGHRGGTQIDRPSSSL